MLFDELHDALEAGSDIDRKRIERCLHLFI
jgi:hypothetical protein